MKPHVSLIDETPKPEQPIDRLSNFEMTSDHELAQNISEQIEYMGTQLIFGGSPEYRQRIHAQVVHEVMMAYLGRKLIRVPEFTVHWFDSYRIVRHKKGSGADIIWTGPNGAECRREFKIYTNLLHSVGREYLRQIPGAVEFKRGKYQQHNSVAYFMLNKD